MTQLTIPQVVVETIVDGVEMGVLSDGTAYLTIRGLAAVCGVAASTIIEPFQAWAANKRTGALAKHVLLAGYSGERLSIELNATRHAVPDSICVTVLGYYAMKGDNPTATRSLYVLAKEGLSKFIYRATGYNPAAVFPPAWRDFHERVKRSVAVPGYFSVFREMNEMLIRAINAGMPFSAAGNGHRDHRKRRIVITQIG